MIVGRAMLVCAAVVVAVGLIGRWVQAEPGVVVTQDGSRFEGTILESDESVTVTIHGVQTVIPRRDVASVQYRVDYEEDFRRRLADLPAEGVGPRIVLAREAFDQRRYDLAREAAIDALRVDPNSREAVDMLDLVDRQIRLERQAPAQPAAEREPPAPRPVTARPALADRRLLTEDDINTIRQKELKLSDTNVRIAFQGDVRQRFAQRHNLTFAEFNRMPQVQQAIQIIDRGDDQMRRQVRIRSDPSAIADYKRFVQQIVLTGCATANCHGAPGAGNFMLYSPADSDAVSYTNFYILTQTAGRAEGAQQPGIFGSSVRRMIERGRGDTSLLVNYALPTTLAEFDHPEVAGKPVAPIFRNRQDPRYEQVVRWMNESLARIEPDYGVDYALPRTPATRPATQPAP